MFQHMKCDEYCSLFQAPPKIVTATIVKTYPKNDERGLGPLPDHARLNFNWLVFASFLLSERLIGLRGTALKWYEKKTYMYPKTSISLQDETEQLGEFFFFFLR